MLILNISAYAQPGISDLGAYSGRLFYWDTVEGRISLLDVKPVAKNPAKKDEQTALAVEYEAIPFSGASIHTGSGEGISFEDANNYADSDVVAIIAHTSEGLRVLSIQFK